MLSGYQAPQPYTGAGQTGQWSVYVPPNPSGDDMGLAILLHGDGDNSATDYTNDIAWQRFAWNAQLILLSVGSPDTACWWTPRKHDRVDYLLSLLDTEVFPHARIDLDRVHMAGFSGGAFWASGAPFYRDLPFHGGIVGVCGGDVPRENTDTDWCVTDENQDDPALPQQETWRTISANHPLMYIRTADDPWSGNMDAAVALWKDLGGTAEQLVTGPGGHCELDGDRWLRGGLARVDRKVQTSPR